MPCQGELVVLPGSGAVYSLRPPESRPVEVAGLRLADDNESLSRWEWRALVAQNGRDLGPSPPTVRLGPLAPLAAGAPPLRCQEGDWAAYLAEVCARWREGPGPRAEGGPCAAPLEVEGHCGPYCGARLRLEPARAGAPGPGAALRLVGEFFGRVRPELAAEVHWHARPGPGPGAAGSGALEVLLADRRPENAAPAAGPAARELGAFLARALDEYSAGVGPGWRLELEASGGRLATGASPLLAALASLLLVLGLVLAGFLGAGYSPRQ